MRSQNICALGMTFIGLIIALATNENGIKNSSVQNNSVKIVKVAQDNKIDTSILNDYNNPGVVKCTGYINVRRTPNLDGDINVIASAENLTLCDILTEYNDDWYQVKFGDITGYAMKKYIVTGEDIESLLEYTEVDENKVLKDTYEYKEPFKGYLLNGIATDNNSIRKPDIDGIILKDSEVSTIKYNDDFDILLDGTNIKYIDSDSIEKIGTKYRKITESKKQSSFINEYNNFGVSINDTLIEIKDRADVNATSIGILPSHSCLEIINKEADWTEIASGNVHGYIETQYVLDGDEAKEYGIKHSRLKAFTSDIEENVYSEKSRLGKLWDKLGKNKVYDILETDGYWIKVDLGSGDTEGDSQDAYVNIEDESVQVKYSLNIAIPYLELIGNNDAPPEKVNEQNVALRYKVIDYACQFIGNPYVWGGTSLTDGADCSGYVQSVLRHFGVYVPRTSREQAVVGIPVESPDKLQPGDLIFYANSSGTVNHVAMYIGNGMIVNAGSSKSGILINTYNYRTPVAMRNVIGDRVR